MKIAWRPAPEAPKAGTAFLIPSSTPASKPASLSPILPIDVNRMMATSAVAGSRRSLSVARKVPLVNRQTACFQEFPEILLSDAIVPTGSGIGPQFVSPDPPGNSDRGHTTIPGYVTGSQERNLYQVRLHHLALLNRWSI